MQGPAPAEQLTRVAYTACVTRTTCNRSHDLLSATKPSSCLLTIC